MQSDILRITQRFASFTNRRERSEFGQVYYSTLLTVATSHHEGGTISRSECERVFTQLDGLQFRQVYSVTRRRRNNYRRKSVTLYS